MMSNIPLVITGYDPEQLRLCNAGDPLKLWTKPDYPYINAYRKGSAGGQGKTLWFGKEENPEFAAMLESGEKLWIEIERSNENRFEVILRHESK